MRTIKAGNATFNGLNGADVHLYYLQKLPEYYVSKRVARKAGWINWKGNLHDVLPGKMIGGNIFQNRDEKLPVEDDRIWYETDINYTSGYRTKARIVFSNDGLIFVTYDHYHTFYEIVK